MLSVRPPTAHAGAAANRLSSARSQFLAGREQDEPSFLDRLRDEAAYWGKTIGRAYGEPFACREPVALCSLSTLI